MFKFSHANLSIYRCVLTPPPQPAKEDPDSHLKEVIGQTIRDEYFRAGHTLTPEQLDILVKTQFDRVCERRNRQRTPPVIGKKIDHNPFNRFEFPPTQSISHPIINLQTTFLF